MYTCKVAAEVLHLPLQFTVRYSRWRVEFLSSRKQTTNSSCIQNSSKNNIKDCIRVKQSRFLSTFCSGTFQPRYLMDFSEWNCQHGGRNMWCCFTVFGKLTLKERFQSTVYIYLAVNLNSPECHGYTTRFMMNHNDQLTELCCLHIVQQIHIQTL